ncbi:MAG TPA: hypothetical protein VMR74_12715 [Gammaproteobacteria bacterium]|nr:hypothetical protein [Gammaproteobacteria bacterium]
MSGGEGELRRALIAFLAESILERLDVAIEAGEVGDPDIHKHLRIARSQTRRLNALLREQDR